MVPTVELRVGRVISTTLLLQFRCPEYQPPGTSRTISTRHQTDIGAIRNLKCDMGTHFRLRRYPRHDPDDVQAKPHPFHPEASGGPGNKKTIPVPGKSPSRYPSPRVCRGDVSAISASMVWSPTCTTATSVDQGCESCQIGTAGLATAVRLPVARTTSMNKMAVRFMWCSGASRREFNSCRTLIIPPTPSTR